MAYLTFELDDGTKVYIEASDMPKNSPGLLPAGRGEGSEKTAVIFEKQVAGVVKMATAMMNEFRAGMGEPPSDVDIAFGLKASGELGGLVISRVGGEASFSVSVRWRANDKDEEKKAE